MPKEFRDWRKVMLFYIWDFVFYVNSIKLSNFAQNIFNRNKYDISTTCMLKFVNGNNFWKNSISISFFFSFERYGCLQVITDWFSVDHLFLYFSTYWFSISVLDILWISRNKSTQRFMENMRNNKIDWQSRVLWLRECIG